MKGETSKICLKLIKLMMIKKM